MNELSHLSRKTKIMLLSILLILVAAAALGGVYLSRPRTAESSNAPLSASEQLQIAKDISDVMLISPTDTPNITRIQDLSKLADQPFFSQAKPGDVVAVYSESKRAIIWRPSIKKIVEVSVIDVTNAAQ